MSASTQRLSGALASMRGPFAMGTPRTLILYARSRGLLASLAAGVATCGLLWWLRDWGERDEIRQALLVQIVPALIASVIGASVASPFGEAERTSARSLPRIRALHLAALFLPALGLAAMLVSAWEPRSPDVDLALVVVRNTIGLAGVALLGVRLVDPRLSWIGPLIWTAFALIGTLLIPLNNGTFSTPWQGPWWAWTARSDASALTWTFALGLGIAGTVVLCRFGPRDDPGETD